MPLKPQELRASLCGDLADLERAAGRIPDTRGIETCVDHDVALWAAQLREQKPQYATAPQRRAEDERHKVAKRAAREKEASRGKALRFQNNGPCEDEVKQRCACGGSACHHCKLRLRVAALIEPKPMAERNPHLPLSEAYKNCRHPTYAKRIIALWAWMKTPQALLLREAGELERRVQRKMEDIADASSTAVIGMGGWR